MQVKYLCLLLYFFLSSVAFRKIAVFPSWFLVSTGVEVMGFPVTSYVFVMKAAVDPQMLYLGNVPGLKTC